MFPQALPSCHFVTGANGFLGSNLVRHLLHNDHRVVAMTRGNPRRVHDAIKHAASTHRWPIDAEQLARLHVVTYSFDDGLARLNPRDISGENTFCLWHAAAKISFLSSDIGELTQVNVNGTRKLLDWFDQHAAADSCFFYVSTAYVCGKTSGDLREIYYPNESLANFHNPYEYTKRCAENLVHDRLKRSAHRCFIFRPGQIVGDSDTGEAATGYGVYRFAEFAHSVASRGHRVLNVGVDPDAALHLISIDHCVRAMTSAAQHLTPIKCHPRIVHVLPDKPLRIDAVLQAVSAVTGSKICWHPIGSYYRKNRSAVDRIIERKLAPIIPYVRRVYNFRKSAMASLRAELKPAGNIDSAILKRTLRRHLLSN